jgi:hypothetical protein
VIATQRAAILRILLEAKGAWVPLPRITACAAQYNARIFELRRLGWIIENRAETQPDGERHTWFRLTGKKLNTLDETPPIETRWADRPRATGLPLFDAGKGKLAMSIPDEEYAVVVTLRVTKEGSVFASAKSPSGETPVEYMISALSSLAGLIAQHAGMTEEQLFESIEGFSKNVSARTQ